MKVSLYEAVRDGLQASMLLEALPDLRLRLDANRAWTLEKARQFARYISPALRARIDFIEEPCQTRDASRQFAQETGIAIAWDESVREADFRIVAEPGLAALVIKPTLTGSLTQIDPQSYWTGPCAGINRGDQLVAGIQSWPYAAGAHCGLADPRNITRAGYAVFDACAIGATLAG